MSKLNIESIAININTTVAPVVTCIKGTDILLSTFNHRLAHMYNASIQNLKFNHDTF